MSAQTDWATETARIIVESQSLYTRANGDPFFFSSGWASPLFIDCKKLISTPSARSKLVEMSVAHISSQVNGLGAIAGCELTGVPFATLIADRLDLPLTVVCKQRKGFGRLAQFEGNFEPGERFMLVDDLATDGESEAVFGAALTRAEAEIVGTFVLIDYGVFPNSRSMLSLAKLADVISVAEDAAYFGERELEEIRRFTSDAAQWSKRHGGIGAL